MLSKGRYGLGWRWNIVGSIGVNLSMIDDFEAQTSKRGVCFVT